MRRAVPVAFDGALRSSQKAVREVSLSNSLFLSLCLTERPLSTWELWLSVNGGCGLILEGVEI